MRGRGKGPQFERDICRRLSLWWSRGARDDIFWRTSQSGGRAKTRTKTGQRTFGQYGDIQATDPIGRPLLEKMTIEVKKGYSKETAFNAIDRLPRFGKVNTSTWEKFLLQAKTDAKNAGTRFWMLIHKRDGREVIVFVPREFYIEMEPMLRHCHPAIWLTLHSGEDVFGTTIPEFLDWVQPDDIRSSPIRIRKKT